MKFNCSWNLEDNHKSINNQLDEILSQFLIEAGKEVVAQTARVTRVDEGQLKSSWDCVVKPSEGVAVVGSPLENAIWEEFGTGIHAVNGNGRKTGWAYVDRHGNTHFTRGKKANHTLQKGFGASESNVMKRAAELFGEVGK